MKVGEVLLQEEVIFHQGSGGEGGGIDFLKERDFLYAQEEV